MSVQITINGADAAETVRELSALASHFLTPGVAPIAVDPVKTSKPNKTTAETPKPTDTEPEEKESDVADQQKDSNDDDNAGPIPTVVELRAKAQELGAAKKPNVKALLDEFEVPNITAVPENRRAEFLSRLGSL